jgi:hypothetical protein
MLSRGGPVTEAQGRVALESSPKKTNPRATTSSQVPSPGSPRTPSTKTGSTASACAMPKSRKPRNPGLGRNCFPGHKLCSLLSLLSPCVFWGVLLPPHRPRGQPTDRGVTALCVLERPVVPLDNLCSPTVRSDQMGVKLLVSVNLAHHLSFVFVSISYSIYCYSVLRTFGARLHSFVPFGRIRVWTPFSHFDLAADLS